MRLVTYAIDVVKGRWKKNKWLLLYEGYNYLYDYPFYGWMMLKWGIAGGLVAGSISFAQNVIMFWWHDRKGIDWASAQELRTLELKTKKTWYEKLFVWFGKRKTRLWERLIEPIVYVLLLMRFDPLLVAIHFQREHFKGLKARDWLNIVSAVVIANFWWALQVGVVTTAGKLIWKFIQQFL